MSTNSGSIFLVPTSDVNAHPFSNPGSPRSSGSQRGTPKPNSLNLDSPGSLGKRRFEFEKVSPRSRKGEGDSGSSSSRRSGAGAVKAKGGMSSGSSSTETFVKWNNKTYRIRILKNGKDTHATKAEVASHMGWLLEKLQDNEQGFVAENVKSARVKLSKKKTEKNFRLKSWNDITYKTPAGTDGVYRLPASITWESVKPTLEELEESVSNLEDSDSEIDLSIVPSRRGNLYKDHINPPHDGNCVYDAMVNQAEQMNIVGFPKNQMKLRKNIGEQIQADADALSKNDDDAMYLIFDSLVDSTNHLTDVTVVNQNRSTEIISRAEILSLLQRKPSTMTNFNNVEKLKLVKYYAGYIQQNKKWGDWTFFYFFTKYSNKQVAILTEENGQLVIYKHFAHEAPKTNECLFLILNQNQRHFYSFNRSLKNANTGKPELDEIVESFKIRCLRNLRDQVKAYKRDSGKVSLESLQEWITNLHFNDRNIFDTLAWNVWNKLPGPKDKFDAEEIYQSLLKNPTLLADPIYNGLFEGLLDEKKRRIQASNPSSASANSAAS